MFFVHVLLYFLVQSVYEEQWRFAYQNGTIVEARGELKLSAEQRSHLRSAWVWSAAQAPRQIDPAQLGKKLSSSPPTRLAVRVSRRSSTPAPRDLHLIAAPVAMWNDLPESALPKWPVPPQGRFSIPFDPGQSWRVRVAGKGEGTWWIEVPPGTRNLPLTAVPAPDVEVEVVSPRGEPLSVEAIVSEGVPRSRESRAWARLRSESGRLSLPGLPDAEPVTLAVLHPEYRPALLRERVPDLPKRLALEAGATLSGRFLSRARTPVAGARIELEAWAASEGRQRITFRGESGKDGRWEIKGVPAGTAAFTVQAPGFAALRQPLEVAGEPQSLGDILLEAGHQLAVLVVDERGEAVPGAKVEAGSGIEAIADRRGLGLLTGLPVAPAEIRASAGRHLGGKTRVNPPFPPQVRVEIRRAFVVTGRLVDSGGEPVAEGSVRVDQPSCFRNENLGADGRFELDLEPEAAAALLFRSPGTRELRVSPSPGAPGELRDLGDLTAARGFVVTGRVVDEQNAPVPGARVWAPRPGPDGPALAWADGDLLQAVTGPAGRFRLTGLNPGSLLLRIEAPGLARAHREVAASDEEPEIEVGDIRLAAGTTLRVFAESEPEEPAVARVDLRGLWLEPDLLTAPLREGEAVLRHVPAGRATVSVLAGRSLLCEREVEIGPGGDQEVDCRREGMVVAGTVLVGNAPAGPGTLIWRRAGDPMPAKIDTTTTPGGLRRQEIYGLGRPQEDVPVGGDGAFQTDRLTPGRWQVSWMSAAGSVSRAREVDLPRVETFQTILSFPGQAVSGIVLDEEDRPVAGARIHDLIGGGLAFSQGDGSFALTSLEARDRVALQASLEGRTSPVVERALQPGRSEEPAVLKLGDDSRPELQVYVMGPDGRPAANAFVFVEEAGRGVRILTTENDGRAVATVSAPLPPQVRFSATSGSAWVFGTWMTWEQARSGSILQLGTGGAIEVTSEDQEGSLEILAPGGWHLAGLLWQLGSPARVGPGQPFQMGGLPAGIYTLSLGDRPVSVEVRSGEAAQVTMN